MEANDDKRCKYLNSISDIELNNLVYIDESGIEQSICKDRGWGLKNKNLIGKKSGKYYERTNIIAGYVAQNTIAPLLFYGSCNTEFFEIWVEKCLIKELIPGQYVILDNASFHKSRKTVELIESVGCFVIFLPPYSPDLNPIEKFWANMKRWIKQNIVQFNSLYEALSAFFVIT